jgi:hypothetical protein
LTETYCLVKLRAVTITMATTSSKGGDDTGVEPDGGSTTGTPRWVKVSVIVVLALVVMVVIVLLIGGNHGPGRHASPSGVTGHGVQQP